MIVLFFAFLPISTFLFFIKDDAFTGYFPPKYFMSESIHAGHLPLWNPYINFGLPQYGDMSCGYWSPITWFIASTVGYNAYTLTAEVLLYILLGGIGMYKLTQSFQLERHTCIIAGLAYMCCGYNIGHLQHFNWLSGAAFLPWCFRSYLLLLNRFSIKRVIRAALLFYMLAASAHPGITIAAVYFFLAIALFTYVKNHRKDRMAHLRGFLRMHGLLVLLVLLLSIGMLTGYLDILPHFVRGEKITMADTLLAPTTLSSWMSTLLPFSIVKNPMLFQTDITMRNCYFSLILLLFLLIALAQKKSKWQRFLLITGLAFMLLSFGSIFKLFAYYCIPYIGYVRLNGEFRIFALLCFILAAAIELDKYITGKCFFEGRIKWLYYSIEILLAGCIVYGIYRSVEGHESFLASLHNIRAQHGLATKLKSLIDSIRFYDTLWIQGLIQLVLLWGIKWCLKGRHWNVLKDIVIVDMVLASLLNVPYTGVGKTSVAHIQEILHQAPKGIPIPVLQPVILNDTLPAEEKAMIGDWSMYSKQIGTTGEISYPVVLKNERTYFDTLEKDTRYAFLEKPFLFLQTSMADSMSSFHILSYTPNALCVTTTTTTPAHLVLQQNFYPHWYYESNGTKKTMEQAGINFMQAPVAKGTHTVVFRFEPAAVKRAMMISLGVFICCCLLLFFLKEKEEQPDNTITVA